MLALLLCQPQFLVKRGNGISGCGVNKEREFDAWRKGRSRKSEGDIVAGGAQRARKASPRGDAVEDSGFKWRVLVDSVDYGVITFLLRENQGLCVLERFRLLLSLIFRGLGAFVY
jgi:hypothetical protein